MKSIADICAMYTASPPTAVVLDDDRTFLEVFQRLLESEEFQVQSFDNASDALASIRNHQPSVAFVDIYLAGEDDGVTVMKQMRALRPNMPIVAISAIAAERDVSKAISECGIAVFVEKTAPLSEQMIRDITEWFALKRCTKKPEETK